ncbi:hypothetical protein ACIBO4_33400 [Streptomyces sp. NPDC050149]|uniref:hypothetical protein n=1 Tax=Streptomyces sp. NPDC050149 TaxID=3365603 RepID=UPI00378FF067
MTDDDHSLNDSPPSSPSAPHDRDPGHRSCDTLWTTRPETAGDIAAVHAVNAAAFPTEAEADLVDALREDPSAWLPGLSYVAEAPDGHPEYYPKFGFVPASRYGIRPGFEVPDEAMMALVLDGSAAVAQGTIEYPAAFGV